MSGEGRPGGGEQLRADGLRVEDIDTVEVRTYTTATEVAGNADPRTAFEAKFSIAYCVAAAFRLGSVRLRAFEPAALADGTLREVMRRTTVVADDGMERLFPDRRQATVTVRERSGATRTAERHTRKGDPDDPLTDAELGEKFADLAVPVIGESAATALAGALWSLPDLPRVPDLPLPSAREESR